MFQALLYLVEKTNPGHSAFIVLLKLLSSITEADLSSIPLDTYFHLLAPSKLFPKIIPLVACINAQNLP